MKFFNNNKMVGFAKQQNDDLSPSEIYDHVNMPT